MTDSELIDQLGGPSRVAELLALERWGAQRVCNWRKRGIPARVKLQYPHLFLVAGIGAPAPAASAEEVRDAA